MRPADAYAGMLLGCIEMLQHGITTSAEMYMHADSVAQAALAAGSRMLLAPSYFDVPGAPWRSAMREIDDRIDAVGLRFGPGDRIELGLATRGGTCLNLMRAEHLDGPGYDGFDWIYAAKLPG